MAISTQPLILFVIIFFISQSPFSTQSLSTSSLDSIQTRETLEHRRSLLSFKETPTGVNNTFECSPSGPCVSCLYSEKSDDKYRCSETGYHIPLRCVELKGVAKLKKTKKPSKDKDRSTMENSHEGTTTVGHRRLLRLLGDSPPSGGSSKAQSYITYRSCIPAVFEEKLSVLGFEVIMLGLLLISGPVVYFRRKGTIAMSGVGPVRVQSNSRF